MKCTECPHRMACEYTDVKCPKTGDVSGWVQLPADSCEVCDGRGKVRANYTNADGKYVFHKETCYACGGKGQMDYVKCVHCDGVVHNGCENEHVCPD